MPKLMYMGHMINITDGAALLDAVRAALPICRRRARRQRWRWGWMDASAEDIAGDVYIYLSEHGITDARPEDIGTAIANALRCLQADEARRAALIELDSLPEYMDILRDPRPGPEHAAIINDILSCNDSKYGDIIRLIYYGYTDTEIAQLLGLARRTVYTRKREIATIYRG